MDRLTPQQERALTLACRGLSNAQIAERMCLQEQSVRNHLMNAYRTLGDAGLGLGIRHKRAYFAYRMGLRDGLRHGGGESRDLDEG